MLYEGGYRLQKAWKLSILILPTSEPSFGVGKREGLEDWMGSDYLPAAVYRWMSSLLPFSLALRPKYTDKGIGPLVHIFHHLCCSLTYFLTLTVSATITVKVTVYIFVF